MDIWTIPILISYLGGALALAWACRDDESFPFFPIIPLWPLAVVLILILLPVSLLIRRE